MTKSFLHLDAMNAFKNCENKTTKQNTVIDQFLRENFT